MKYQAIIFDGSNAIHRLASAVPPLTNHAGERVEVMFGLLKLLSSVSRANPATACYICFDGKGSREIRQKIDPVYKDRRGKNWTEEDQARIDGMHAQTARFWTLFGQHLPINWLISTTYEADDIMAMIAAEYMANGKHSLIVSGDGDMLQLVSPLVTVFSPTRNDYCTPASFSKYTKGFLNGEAWLYGKVLQGEPPTGDNIPGIRGVGEGWAKKLLEMHDWNLPKMLTSPTDEMKKSKLGKAILCAEGRDRIAKNYKLMSLRGHKGLKADKVEIRKGKLDKRQLQINLAKNQFSSILVSFNQFIAPFMSFGG